MVVHGECIDLGCAEGLIAIDEGQIIGLVTYRIQGREMEILSLDSVREGMGIGTLLLSEAIGVAKHEGCTKIVLTTTNDNTVALAFYQKRGFDIVRIRRNALDIARQIKPEIPLTGENGIPLRHEIDLEMAV